MSADLLGDLDRYIDQLAPGASRPEAIRKLVADALLKMGFSRSGQS